MGNGGLGFFSKVMALFAYLRHPTKIFQRNFSIAELSKALKKANGRLNTTWNTTQSKAQDFFLFSLRLLLTNLPYTSVARISVARALFRIRAHAWR